MISKTQAIKKINWFFSKVKSCVHQNIIKHSNKITNIIGEIFASHIFDKGFISRIYKEFL